MSILLGLLLLNTLAWIIGIILGVAKAIRANLPHKPTQATQTYFDAWEMYNAYLEDENKKARERDYLTALIANLEDLQRIAERGERNETQLRKIISLDKQIHAAQQKIEKLG